MVARDNFGPQVAQIAAVALLIDYTVTVAVQTSAGTAALTSAVPSLANTFDTVAITVGVVLLLLYGNLRGIREAGKFFAFPMYFYVVALGIVIITGYVKEALARCTTSRSRPTSEIFGGHLGTPGEGLLMGLAFITLLRAFANGGSSLTGLEAISNGVGSFRRPASVHARQTLVVMSSLLAFLVLGTSLLAKWTHAVPYASGSPTVVSQEVQAVFGRGFFYFVVQLATLLILYTGGNTSFNGFPFLANFVAGDHYLPRQLTRRGHRLAFSNGILVLAAVSIALVLVFKAQVDGLVALYAIGVFTGFTMAGAGMVKHHLTQKGPHWRRSVAVNGVLVLPLGRGGPDLRRGEVQRGRLGRSWWSARCSTSGSSACTTSTSEESVAARDGRGRGLRGAHPAPSRRRRPGRPARHGHRPSPAVRPHAHARRPARRALRHRLQGGPGARGGVGPSRAWPGCPLDIIECPDRRLGRAAIELVADATLDGDTECTVLLPRRGYSRVWQRFLHDRTADKIAAVLSQVPHVAATIIPYNLPGRFGEKVRRYGQSVQRARLTRRRRRRRIGRRPVDTEGRTGVEEGADRGATRREAQRKANAVSEADDALARRAGVTTPISDVAVRQRVKVAGRVKSVRVQPRAGTSNLECVLSDGTGGLLLVFQGRPKIAGIEPGARLVAEGMVGAWGRRPAMLNPSFELVAGRRRPAGD